MESIKQHNAEEFTIRLLDKSGKTITSYDFNIKKILQNNKLQELMEQYPFKYNLETYEEDAMKRDLILTQIKKLLERVRNET